ncbi:MAG: hypothetical protein P8L32_06215 [Paracoccaceae bacterium]|nr:hypothetical protein [Paracoccaceae bacterium]
MLIERNAFENNRAAALVNLRDNCLGCKDCDGPCRSLMQLRDLPEILLGSKGASH